MALQRIVGNEGTVTFGIGTGTEYTEHNLIANAWSMTISRVISDVSAYGDTAANVIGGVPTYSGSVSGFMETGASNSPEIDPIDFASIDRVYFILLSATGCFFSTINDAYGRGATVTGVSVSSSKTGDATISFDFSVDGYLTEDWDDS